MKKENSKNISCRRISLSSSFRSVFVRNMGERNLLIAAPIFRTPTFRNDEARQGGADRHGFTLIELLVVVLIIGILAAVALPQYQKAVMKSRFLTIKTLTQKIVEAEGAYYLANGEYTSDLDALSIDIPNLTSAQKQAIMSNYYYPWGRCVIDGLDNKYAQCSLYAVNQKIYGKEILSYQVWFVTKRVWCRAHLNNTTANEVCKNDGAHKIGNGSAGETIYEY